MMYPLVQDLAVDGIPVTLSCRVLGFSKQAFYKWQANPVTDREWADAHLINTAMDIHADDPAFGYRFIADELAERRIVGYSMSHRMTAALAVSALSNAVALRDPDGTTVHSDRGSQFRSTAFVTARKHHRLVGSMGRVGACGDKGGAY